MFSTAVKLSGLNDFVDSVSQECIKPLYETKGGNKENSKEKPIQLVDENIDITKQLIVEPNLIRRTRQKNDKIGENKEKSVVGKVSLVDCLACSGCVTSAEVVLLGNQSVEEILRIIPTKPIVIFSISFQSRLSLALYYNIPVNAVLERLFPILTLIGVDYILDMTMADAIVLLEHEHECRNSMIMDEVYKNKPIFTSHCPGWVCYAEKFMTENIISGISKIRSSQDIQGILVKTIGFEIIMACKFIIIWKHLWTTHTSLLNYKLFNILYIVFQRYKNINNNNTCNNMDIENENDIFHVCIMPCYDKKIEAQRSFTVPDDKSWKNPFFNPDTKIVDAVLSTTELVELINKTNHIDITKIKTDNHLENNLGFHEFFIQGRQTNTLKNSCAYIPEGDHNIQYGSGGFLKNIISTEKIINSNSYHVPKLGEDPNRQQFSLHINDEKNTKKWELISIYGFKYIQNFLKMDLIKQNNLASVEIMACPGGCLNGGGNLKLDNNLIRKRFNLHEPINQKIPTGVLEQLLVQNNEIRILSPNRISGIYSLYCYWITKFMSDKKSTEKSLHHYLCSWEKEQINNEKNQKNWHNFTDMAGKLPFMFREYSSIKQTKTKGSLTW